MRVSTAVAQQGLELEPWVQVGTAGAISGFPILDMRNNDAVSPLHSAISAQATTHLYTNTAEDTQTVGYL